MGTATLYTLIQAEVKANCGDGGITTYFSTVAADNRQRIILDAAHLPPGAVVELKYPCCPECGMPRMDKLQLDEGEWIGGGYEDYCECGLDWNQWVREHYS